MRCVRVCHTIVHRSAVDCPNKYRHARVKWRERTSTLLWRGGYQLPCPCVRPSGFPRKVVHKHRLVQDGSRIPASFLPRHVHRPGIHKAIQRSAVFPYHNRTGLAALSQACKFSSASCAERNLHPVVAICWLCTLALIARTRAVSFNLRTCQGFVFQGWFP